MNGLRRLAGAVRRRWLHCLWQVRCKLSPNKIARFALDEALRFDYPLRSAVGYQLSVDAFETAEVSYLKQVLKRGDIVIDIGANGGIYTVLAANHVGPYGHVYAFEPGQRELELLKHNIELNKLQNITVIETAVSDSCGTARFAISSDGALNSLEETGHPLQQVERWETVRTITLDEAVTQLAIPSVDFIKIDVEGAEKLVFRGAKRTLASNPHAIVLFEVSDLTAKSFEYSARAFLSELVASGSYVYYFAESGKLARVLNYNPLISGRAYNYVASSQPLGS